MVWVGDSRLKCLYGALQLPHGFCVQTELFRSWTVRPKSYCTKVKVSTGGVPSLRKSLSRCAANSNCIGVVSEGCNATNGFFECLQVGGHDTFSPSIDSCVVAKQHVKWKRDPSACEDLHQTCSSLKARLAQLGRTCFDDLGALLHNDTLAGVRLADECCASCYPQVRSWRCELSFAMSDGCVVSTPSQVSHAWLAS